MTDPEYPHGDALVPERREEHTLVLLVRPPDAPEFTEEELDPAKGRELFANAPPAYFSVVGQVTEPGRAFHPSANGVEVRALYNRREIAFLVSWHDMRADQAGTNAPDLPVPPEEDGVFVGQRDGAPSHLVAVT